MTQDAKKWVLRINFYIVLIQINLKSYYDFVFHQYCVFFIQRIQVCDARIRRPEKTGNLSDPQKRKFCETKKSNSKTFGQTSTPSPHSPSISV